MSVKFEDALEDTDYGFIVCGKTGRLKGIWIPDGNNDDLIPDTVASLCKDYFGIDPNKEEDNDATLH